MKQNKILFVWPNKDRFGFKPIGLSLLSGIAKKEGFKTKLFDTTEIDLGFKDSNKSYEEAKIFKPVNFEPYNINKKKINLNESFLKVFNEFNPSILAFSVLSDEYLIALEITNIAKKINPNIKIIWGGKYPTINPRKTLEEFNVDYVCVGEGLEAFPELLDAIRKEKDTTNIKNIWMKDKGIIYENSLRPLKKELDDLPFVDWDIFDKRFFYKPFNGKVMIGGDHMLNWGCPHHCSYCINHFYHEIYKNNYNVRRYSIKRIIDELVYLKRKYKLNFFKFQDEDFLMRPLDNLKELSKEYKKKVGLPFVIETNSNSVTKEKVELLKEMGCVSVSVGIETGNQKLRKEILNRIDTLENIINAIKLFNEAKIRTSSFNMLGIPFETRKTYEETIKINKEAQIQYPSMAFFFPFEKTTLRDIAIQQKLFFPDGIDKNVDCRSDEPALHFKNLTKQELIEMRNVFVFYVKLPEEYYPFIRRSEKLDDVGKNLRKKIIEIYENTVFKNDGWYEDDGFREKYLEELNKIYLFSNIKKQKIIGIIPARGGSKGIPRKNIKLLAGKPLIAWTIESAKESNFLDEFYVSTEDEEIKEISKRYGAKVIDRPKELATDEASTWDYLKHAIEITGAEIIVLLQPTSPVRKKGLIDKCIKKFIEKNADNLATGFMCKLFEYGNYSANRQNLKGFFHDDGNVYIVKGDLVKKTKKDDGRNLGKISERVIISTEQNFEIDEEFDFWLNEQILKNKFQKDRLKHTNLFKLPVTDKEKMLSEKESITPFELFEIKTKVTFGPGKISKLSDIIKENKFNCIAIILDSSMKNNEKILEVINETKIREVAVEIFYYELNGEPTYDYLDEFKTKMTGNYDCIIGIGGGSTLDLSKGVATLLQNEGRALEYRGFPKLKNKPLPIIAIPTTAGSGSEATYNAVFTETSEKRKLGINSKYNFPIHAILDPELTLSCPETATISSGADALVHCIEAFTVKTTNQYVKMFAREAFKLLFHNLPKVIENPKDIIARGKVLLGAHFAGVATMNSGGAGLSGAMTYPLGGVFKIPHGIAGGVFLPKIIRYNVNHKFKGYAELYDVIEGADKFLSEEEKNKAFVEKIQLLELKLKIPEKLTIFGINRDKLDFLNDYLFDNLKGAVNNNPVEITKEDMKKILGGMF